MSAAEGGKCAGKLGVARNIIWEKATAIFAQLMTSPKKALFKTPAKVYFVYFLIGATFGENSILGNPIIAEGDREGPIVYYYCHHTPLSRLFFATVIREEEDGLGGCIKLPPFPDLPQQLGTVFFHPFFSFPPFFLSLR